MLCLQLVLCLKISYSSSSRIYSMTFSWSSASCSMLFAYLTLSWSKVGMPSPSFSFLGAAFFDWSCCCCWYLFYLLWRSLLAVPVLPSFSSFFWPLREGAWLMPLVFPLLVGCLRAPRGYLSIPLLARKFSPLSPPEIVSIIEPKRTFLLSELRMASLGFIGWSRLDFWFFNLSLKLFTEFLKPCITDDFLLSGAD